MIFPPTSPSLSVVLPPHSRSGMPAKTLAIQGGAVCAPRLGEGEPFVKILNHIPAGLRKTVITTLAGGSRTHRGRFCDTS
jgi:hypothetical protein